MWKATLQRNLRDFAEEMGDVWKNNINRAITIDQGAATVM